MSSALLDRAAGKDLQAPQEAAAVIVVARCGDRGETGFRVHRRFRPRGQGSGAAPVNSGPIGRLRPSPVSPALASRPRCRSTSPSCRCARAGRAGVLSLSGTVPICFKTG
jgi:hypothetical protein